MGSYLRIKKEELDEIEQDFSTSYQRFIEMFHHWLLRDEYCTWSAIKTMLREMGKKAVAEHIDHYITEHQRIIEKHFENDRLSHYPDPTLEEWLEKLPRCLTDVASKWLRIGIALNLPKSDLDEIDKDHEGDCDRKLQEVIARWHSERSWRNLIDTFRDLDFGAIAEFIEDEAWRKVKRENEEDRMEHHDEYMSEHWKEIVRRKDQFILQLNQRKHERNRVYKNYVRQVRDALKPPSDVSDEELMSDPKRYILLSCKQKNIKKIIEIIVRIQECHDKLFRWLCNSGEKFADDKKYAQKIQGKLNERKQKLEEEKSPTDDVKEQLKDIESICVALNDQSKKCIEELEACKKEYYICKEIIDACEEGEKRLYDERSVAFSQPMNDNTVCVGHKPIKLDPVDDLD